MLALVADAAGEGARSLGHGGIAAGAWAAGGRPQMVV